MAQCPVCNGQKLEEMLSLAHQPIYQHPVSRAKDIEKPYFKDLHYFFCRNCEHSFQKTWDISVLEKLYKEYYYTPRPPDIGVQFQNHFMQALIEQFKVLDSVDSILEVGCSAGEILTKIDKISPDKILAGFEPNSETAAKASKSGFLVHGEFFTAIASQKINKTFDLIFHRHVIEHVFDFKEFFRAHRNVSHGNTMLIIETPCLNWSTQNLSMAPFHIEHVHVFSIRSLKILLEKYNWYLKDYLVISNGHLIGLFTRKECNLSIPEVANPLGLPAWIEKNKTILENALKGKKMALWGAGSGGIKVINYFNLCPDAIVDSNPGKAGKKFVGYENLEVIEANAWIEQEYQNSQSWLIIVTSTYFEEITSRLKQAGWKGEIVQPYALSGGLHG